MSELARALVEHIEGVRPLAEGTGTGTGTNNGDDVEVRVRTLWLRARREHAFEVGSLCVHFSDERRAWPLKAFFTADECCALMLAMMTCVEEETRHDETTNRDRLDVVHDVLVVPTPIDVTQRLLAAVRARRATHQ